MVKAFVFVIVFVKILFFIFLFDCTEPLVQRKPIISLIQPKCRALSVVQASPRLIYAEGSLIR